MAKCRVGPPCTITIHSSTRPAHSCFVAAMRCVLLLALVGATLAEVYFKETFEDGGEFPSQSNCSRSHFSDASSALLAVFVYGDDGCNLLNAGELLHQLCLYLSKLMIPHMFE